MADCLCTKEGSIASFKSEIANVKEDIKNIKQYDHTEIKNKIDKDVGSVQKQVDDLGNVYELIYELVSSVKVLGEQMSVVKSDVEDLKTVPKKRYEHLLNTLVSVVVGAIITLLFTRIGVI